MRRTTIAVYNCDHQPTTLDELEEKCSLLMNTPWNVEWVNTGDSLRAHKDRVRIDSIPEAAVRF